MTTITLTFISLLSMTYAYEKSFGLKFLTDLEDVQGLQLVQNVPSKHKENEIKLRGAEQFSSGCFNILRQVGCEGLDTTLYKITLTSDPLNQAKQLGLKIKGDKIQVLLILDRKDVSFLQAFNVELGTQSGKKNSGFCESRSALQVGQY